LLNGGLFTRNFLLEGVRDEVVWERLDDANLANVHGRLAAPRVPLDPKEELRRLGFDA
jgi:hypothetical protein